jgi:hypothetical protein
VTFTTADLDGPGQSPKTVYQVGKVKELPAAPDKKKRKRGRARRKR